MYEYLKAMKIHCRNCALVTPRKNGTWHCARFDSEIPADFQDKACDGHILHPDLVPWPMKEGKDPLTACYEIEGVEVYNGIHDSQAGVYSSQDILYTFWDSKQKATK